MILLKFPVPLLGSNETVKLVVLLLPTAIEGGSILKALFSEGSGSMALSSNLKGFSALSKAKFLTMSRSKMSDGFSLALLSPNFSLCVVFCASKPALTWSNIFQLIYTPLIPVFLIIKVLVIGFVLATTVGMGRVG